jgi:hypothetical protein
VAFALKTAPCGPGTSTIKLDESNRLVTVKEAGLVLLRLYLFPALSLVRKGCGGGEDLQRRGGEDVVVVTGGGVVWLPAAGGAVTTSVISGVVCSNSGSGGGVRAVSRALRKSSRLAVGNPSARP